MHVCQQLFFSPKENVLENASSVTTPRAPTPETISISSMGDGEKVMKWETIPLGWARWSTVLGGHALSAHDSGGLKRLHRVCVSSLGLAHTRT